MLNAIFPRAANGRNANAPINPASLALMHWMAEEVNEQQARYAALREWYDGEQDVPLTDRQQEYLSTSAYFPWALNYLRLPVELCVERLTVVGFDGPDGIGGQDANSPAFKGQGQRVNRHLLRCGRGREGDNRHPRPLQLLNKRLAHTVRLSRDSPRPEPFIERR